MTSIWSQLPFIYFWNHQIGMLWRLQWQSKAKAVMIADASNKKMI